MHTEKPASLRLQHGTIPPRRILVVEDDVVLRRVNTQVLIESGYEVDAAEDGAVAWTALQLFDYGLLITDHNLPNVSGIDLLKKLHAARLSLPVILASGTLPTAELDRHPWLQIDAALLKPFAPAELLAAVKNVLRAEDGTRAPIAPSPQPQSQPQL